MIQPGYLDTVRDMKLDIDDILVDVNPRNHIDVELETFSDIYLSIHIREDKGLYPLEHKDDISRVKDYMESMGYKFVHFDNHKAYFLSWVFEWDKLFDIPDVQRYKPRKLTLHFENLNWVYEE